MDAEAPDRARKPGYVALGEKKRRGIRGHPLAGMSQSRQCDDAKILHRCSIHLEKIQELCISTFIDENGSNENRNNSGQLLSARCQLLVVSIM